MTDHLRVALAITALELAIHTRRPAVGRVHHADRDSPYTASADAALLAAHGMRPSLGHPESFLATLQTEFLQRRSWPTRQAAQAAIFEYLEGWYNRCRRHSTLGDLSPVDFATQYHQGRQAA